MSSPRVLITLDPNKLISTSPNTQSVEEIADYIPACLAVRNALRVKQKTKLELLIHHKIVGVWLREWVKVYDSDLVQIRSYTACEALKESWGIDVPSEYEREIVRSGLIEVNVTPREGQSFENVVLEHFYHDFFAYPKLPASHFSRLLNEAVPSRWVDYNKRPLVSRIFRQRLEQWNKNETNEARKEIINRLARDFSTLRQTFAAYKVLRGYPKELAVKVLGDDYELFHRANIDPERLSLRDVNLDSVVTEIEYFLNQQQANITRLKIIH